LNFLFLSTSFYVFRKLSESKPQYKEKAEDPVRQLKKRFSKSNSSKYLTKICITTDRSSKEI